jgi:hypothetical protein
LLQNFGLLGFTGHISDLVPILLSQAPKNSRASAFH